MFDRRIEVYKDSEQKDKFNERLDEKELVGVFHAQRTDAGGTQNLVAARLIYDGEIAFTIRYASQIKAGMYVLVDGVFALILSIHDEGRRKYQHLKCTFNDGEENRF